jgi:hypothetical protein
LPALPETLPRPEKAAAPPITPGDQTVTIADMVDGWITGTATITVKPSPSSSEGGQPSVREPSTVPVERPVMALPLDAAFDPMFFDLSRIAELALTGHSGTFVNASQD